MPAFGAADSIATGGGVDVRAIDGAGSDVCAELLETSIDGRDGTDRDGEAAALVHPTRRTIDRAERAATRDT